jgi:hypothetical protein
MPRDDIDPYLSEFELEMTNKSESLRGIYLPTDTPIPQVTAHNNNEMLSVVDI